jgi:predicted nucleotide-binding protein (sugar kinase/HSP70/actin superfamily)
MDPSDALDWHAARAEHVRVCAVLQRVLRVVGNSGREPRVLGFTSGDLYREGSGRGAIDPCFPAKIGIAHVHNLLFTKHAKKKLDVIFFPMIDKLHTPLVNLQGSNACPTVTVTPETAKAAFTKEADVFAEQGVAYLDPLMMRSVASGVNRFHD